LLVQIIAEEFQVIEEKLVKFAVELERELAKERKAANELEQAVVQEKLEYTKLLDKFENARSSFQAQLAEARERESTLKEEHHKDRERERDMWEKERDRHRNRDSERERELDRMGQRHTAETASLEREKDRQKRELLRESSEVDRLSQEVDRLARRLTDERERFERDKLEIAKRHDHDLEQEKSDRVNAVKECEESIAVLKTAITQEAHQHEARRLAWEEQRSQFITEKGALHATIVDMRREWEDSKSKLNTLAADNILLREVMTDLRVSNSRLGADLRGSLSLPSSQRPEWNRSFAAEKQKAKMNSRKSPKKM
jgi:hypothetical protein